MNLKRIIGGVAVYVSMAMVSQAAMTTTLEWLFNTSANPAAPDSLSNTNPSGGVATAEITSSTYQKYYFNAYPTTPPGGYGTERGLWDTINGQFKLTLGAGVLTPGETLSYTLQVNQFIGDPNFLPGYLTVLGLGTPTSHTQQPLDTTPAYGQWVQDTFTWAAVTPAEGWLSLTIVPDTTPQGASGELILDSFKWSIVGDIAIPEPGTMAIATLGILALGMRTWLRRRV